MATSYAYSDAGLVAHMDSGVLGDVTDYEWLRRGLLKKETTGSHVNDWSWHPDDTVAGVKTTAGGSTKADFQYGYDNNGDMTSQTVTGAQAYTNTYTYTPARNVASWTYQVGGSTAVTTYGWDRNNNRLSASNPAGTVNWSYRLDNSISAADAPGTTSDRSFTYDNAGRLTSDGCNTNTYDDFDRISKVVTSGSTACGGDSRTTDYTYDGLDRQRTIKVTGASPSSANATTSSLYDGMATTLTGQVNAVNGADSTPNVLYQLDSEGSPVALEQAGAGAGKSFLDSDGHGNMTTEVTTGSTVACAIVYDPFGNPISPASGSDVCKSGSKSGTTGNAAGYRSHIRDGSTGKYQLGTRTYDPSTGTFTTPDTYRISDANTDVSVGVDPLTANTYSYVNGNPINLIDPDGHRPLCGGCGGDRDSAYAWQYNYQGTIDKKATHDRSYIPGWHHNFRKSATQKYIDNWLLTGWSKEDAQQQLMELAKLDEINPEGAYMSRRSLAIIRVHEGGKQDRRLYDIYFSEQYEGPSTWLSVRREMSASGVVFFETCFGICIITKYSVDDEGNQVVGFDIGIGPKVSWQTGLEAAPTSVEGTGATVSVGCSAAALVGPSVTLSKSQHRDLHPSSTLVTGYGAGCVATVGGSWKLN